MENVKLILGDCLTEMKNIQDKSIDMILCDLPYGCLSRNNPNAQWDNIIQLDKLWEQYNRIIKDNGAIVLFAQGMFTAQLMMSNPNMWRYNLIWDKTLPTGFLNAKRMPLRSHEDILVFYKSLPTYNPQMSEGKPLHGKGSSYKTKELTNNCYGSLGATEDVRKGSTEKYPTSIVRFQKPHPSCAVHPTQKSKELCEWLIKTYTNEGETVLDNCMGSGTTGVAAINTNRNFIGMELSEKYFNIAEDRINSVIAEKEKQ
jgi:site-specific DNA-methyltransferase (adenine-specific)